MHSETVSGREEAVAQACERLREDGVVCVFGPPGVGKSVFARQIDAGTDRRIVVHARGLTSLDALRRAISQAAQISWDGADVAQLRAMLGRIGRATLVVEDVDTLADVAGEELAALFGEADAMHIIATSMQRLGTPFDFELQPLGREGAHAYFVACVRRTLPAYTPDEAESRAIDELLVALDRLPLGIELAASRRPILSPREMLGRLDARFELLREQRGRALENAVGWAWELLDEEARTDLRKLSAFESSFTLGQAEALLGGGTTRAIELVEELRDRCLLRVSSFGTQTRFELYHTVREYVREQPGDLPFDRHAALVCEQATGLLDELDRGEGGDREGLSLLLPDLQAALRRGKDTCVPALLLDRVFARTATDVARRHALDVGLAQPTDPASRAALLLAHAMCEVDAGDLEQAADDLANALEAARGSGDASVEAEALLRAGDVARRRGEAGDALFLLAQANELAGDEGLERQILAHLGCCQVDHGMNDDARQTVAQVERMPPARSLLVECEVRRRLAYVHFYLGNYAEQHRQGLVALEAAERAQHPRLTALCEQGLGDSATMLGELDEALAAYERALRMHRQLGDLHYEGVLLGNLGTVHHREDQLDEAADRYRQALAIHRRTGARPYEAVVAMSLGLLELERGRTGEADHHLQASAAASEELGRHDDVGAALLGRGWSAVRLGDVDEAQKLFAAAAAAFDRGDAPGWRAVAAYLSGECNHASAAGIVAQHGATAAELLAAAERWRGGRSDAAAPTRSLHVRAANAAIASAGAATVGDAPLADLTLEIAADGSWFDVGEGRVDLRRRRAHRLLLLELVRRQGDTEPLDVFDAFDVGWPDESIGAEAAADRVYWVVGTLRRLGLKDQLITADAGYQLAPGVDVVMV